MKAQVTRPWQPFALAIGLLVVVEIAVFQLPETLLEQIERNGPFTSAQAAWALRLLAFAATVQALFVGFRVLSVDRVAHALENEPKLGEMSKSQIAASLARAGAGVAMLTLVYGLSVLFIGGQRGDFWLFVTIAVAQLTWYFHQTGVITQWLEFQPEPTPHRIRDVWRKEPPDYCPPLARGLAGTSKSQ